MQPVNRDLVLGLACRFLLRDLVISGRAANIENLLKFLSELHDFLTNLFRS